MSKSKKEIGNLFTKEDEDWLKQQAIDLSKQDYEKLVLMQKSLFKMFI